MDNTLSIVPSDGAANEFPVLKAFQEYIDAEQAKARKRMLGLSVFFIVLLLVVVVTFVLILTTMVNRNQALSDRLLDYALKEKEKAAPIVVQQPQPQPVVAPQQPQQSVQDILKPFFDRLEREQAAMKAMYEKQQKEAEEKAREAEAKAAAREKTRDEELRKAKAELEKERLRAKKENDRQAEIERHRRRLYPDYYNIPEQATLPPQKAAPLSAPQATRQQVPPPSPSVSIPAPRQSPAKTAQKPVENKTPKSAAASKHNALSDIKPVSYFNVDDDDGVPFLLETPQNTPKK